MVGAGRRPSQCREAAGEGDFETQAQAALVQDGHKAAGAGLGKTTHLFGGR